MDIQLVTAPNGTVTGAIYYDYHPSAAAAWLFVSLFAAATIAHFVLMFTFRSAIFIPMIIGGTIEAFGYYGRAWSSRNVDNFGPWILQTLLIMAAAPMLSATVYMVLGRTVRALEARKNALMSPRLTTPLFVCADVLAFVSQLAGVGLQAARSAKEQRIGRAVVLAGLVFQVLLFCLSIINTVVFHRRNKRDPVHLSVHPQVPELWKTLCALYVASGCILLRNIVRIAEYGEGSKGEISTHEAFVYVFDGTLIWVAVAALLVVHPGRLILRARRVAVALAKVADEGTLMVDRQSA